MSYDLYFHSRNSVAIATRDEFARYFVGRPHYELNDSQPFYSNEDTGVYFGFEYDDIDSNGIADNDVDSTLLPVSFNLNYFRPHPFGLEAEPEVSSFVKEFDLTVFDPQTSGMGEGEYSAEGFLRGWNAGNEFGYREIANQEAEAHHLALPAIAIASLWRWNYRREERQTEIGETVFVPRIYFSNFDGSVKTGVAWIDGIPILLPEVDLLIIPRDRLAPRRLFRSPANDMVQIHWKQIEPILKRFHKASADLPYYELSYEETPADIQELIRQAEPIVQKPLAVSFDQILDQELLDIARKAED